MGCILFPKMHGDWVIRVIACLLKRLRKNNEHILGRFVQKFITNA